LIKVLTGNKAAAYGVKLSRPDVVAMYPITPQTPLAEELAHFHAEGQLDCEMVEVEGEHTAMSVITGAGVAGGRVFTATSSWGLAYMNEALMYCAGMRIPAVMVDVTRETPSMRGVGGGRQDIMSIRDSGWIQIEPESCQEIIDSVIMAYRLAEDPEVLLPVVVAYDGFYLSHLSERVDIPSQEDVDKFLAPVKNSPRPTLVSNPDLHFSPSIVEKAFAEYRYKTMQAFERTKAKIDIVEQEVHAMFGRKYGGMVDTYRVDDAEILILTAGSCSGTARVVVDQAREKGLKAGLARIRIFRPFPRERLGDILNGKKAVAVIDRSICLGWNCGHLYMEAKAVLSDIPQPPRMFDFIDGLCNLDITTDHIEKALAVTAGALKGRQTAETNWLVWD
jgi:pyruvate/2-oxoacid:ferredoxin oxidoreductase alpha subunit